MTSQEEPIQEEPASQDREASVSKPAEVDLARFLEVALSLLPAGFSTRMIGALIAILSSVVLAGSYGCKKHEATDATATAAGAEGDSGSIGSIDPLKEKMERLVQNILKFIVEIELADKNGAKYRVAGLKMNSKTIAAFSDVFYSAMLDTGKMTIAQTGQDGRVYTFWPPKDDRSLNVHTSVKPQEGIVFFDSDQGFEVPDESTPDLLAEGLRDGQSVFIYSPFAKTAKPAKIAQTKDLFTSNPAPAMGDIVLDENGKPCGFGGPNGAILTFPTDSLGKFGLNHGGTLLQPGSPDEDESVAADEERRKSTTDIPGLEPPKPIFFPSSLLPEPQAPPPPKPQPPKPQPPKPPIPNTPPPPKPPVAPPAQPPLPPRTSPARVAQSPPVQPAPPVQPPVAQTRQFVPVIPMYDPNFQPPAEPRPPRANPVATASSNPRPNPMSAVLRTAGAGQAGNKLNIKMAGPGSDFVLGSGGTGGRGLSPGQSLGHGVGTMAVTKVSIPMAGYKEWSLPSPKSPQPKTDGFGRIHGLGKIDTGGGLGVGSNLAPRKK